MSGGAGSVPPTPHLASPLKGGRDELGKGRDWDGGVDWGEGDELRGEGSGLGRGWDWGVARGEGVGGVSGVLGGAVYCGVAAGRLR